MILREMSFEYPSVIYIYINIDLFIVTYLFYKVLEVACCQPHAGLVDRGRCN